MKTDFLICSYPRSRTLWLSQFFTIPGVCKCEYEATQYAANSEEFWLNADLARPGKEWIYGNSDSGNIFVLPALLAARPLTKVVWILRPMGEVEHSLAAAGFPFNREAARLLRYHHHKNRGLFDLVIPYRSLGQLRVIETLWKFLLEDVPFDYGRWGILEATRVAYTYKNYPRPDTTKLMEFIATEIGPICSGEKSH